MAMERVGVGIARMSPRDVPGPPKYQATKPSSQNTGHVGHSFRVLWRSR